MEKHFTKKIRKSRGEGREMGFKTTHNRGGGIFQVLIKIEIGKFITLIIELNNQQI